MVLCCAILWAGWYPTTNGGEVAIEIDIDGIVEVKPVTTRVRVFSPYKTSSFVAIPFTLGVFGRVALTNAAQGPGCGHSLEKMGHPLMFGALAQWCQAGPRPCLGSSWEVAQLPPTAMLRLSLVTGRARRPQEKQAQQQFAYRGKARITNPSQQNFSYFYMNYT
jgi:hypothetical protein